ncbi:hypothetical protein [Burkholderia sp. Ac-20349]|uniref:hypothetical protein n=1 Tax=Burkholderia sp. Ac-20349 TaxID=2703893 RepID=UPI00197B333C|nr:hypothetical protein [Burkholderia sp. Ac-20349]MBN3839242.1 hypothetical protein [Burkholderia sp. Ac-20349]
MIRIKQVRLDNFLLLAADYPKIADFCRVIQIQPSYYSQVKRGTKVIGDDLAARIETALELPQGWMDTPHNRSEEQSRTLPSDVIGVAYAMASLPEGIRERIKSLVYEMASEFTKIESDRAATRAPVPRRRREEEDGSK